MLTKDDAELRVARGAAHLDQVRPNWFNEINTDTLTLHDPCGCIVGQLCGTGHDFEYGLTQLQVRSVAPGRPRILIAGALGLNLVGCHVPDTFADTARAYRLLQDAWIAAIAARKFPAREVAPALAPDAVATPVDQPVAATSR